MHFNRRSFLKYGSISLLSLPFLGRWQGQALAAPGDEKLPMAKESDKLSQSLKFCSDADKPSKSCPARKEAAHKNEYCHGCQLYTKIDDKTGKCMLMTKNRVPANAWCASWSKKAGT